MKKIVFGITSLTLGGAERVLVDIVNELNKSSNYDIEIFTIYAKGELEKQVDKNVKIKSIYKKKYDELNKLEKILIPLKMLLFRNTIYKKYIKNNYDVEIAFLEGAITRLFSSGSKRKNKVADKKIKKIAWIHNDISLVFGNGLKSNIKKILDERIYIKYDKLVFVSKDNMQKFENVYCEGKYNGNLEKVSKEVIYNYINKDNVILKSKEDDCIKFDKDKINFVTVARLTKQKRIDRIIDVHKKLIDEGIIHNFIVIGDGIERKNLEELIKKNRVGNTFRLLGSKENPYPYISKCDYFCLLSEFEGYGMVLEEAKILERNILITDTAAREAVNNYKNANILENSFEGIYKGIKESVQYGKLDNKDINSAYDDNTYENIGLIKKIENVIDEV